LQGVSSLAQSINQSLGGIANKAVRNEVFAPARTLRDPTAAIRSFDPNIAAFVFAAVTVKVQPLGMAAIRADAWVAFGHSLHYRFDFGYLSPHRFILLTQPG
jgi:hypothetical protein